MMTTNLTRFYTRKYKLFDKLIHPKGIFAFRGERDSLYAITVFKKGRRYYL